MNHVIETVGKNFGLKIVTFKIEAFDTKQKNLNTCVNFSSVVGKRDLKRRKGGSSLAHGEKAGKSSNKDLLAVNLSITVDCVEG